MRGAALAAVLTIAGLAASAGQEAEIRKVLDEPEAIKKTSRKLSKEARQKVETALGAKLEDREIPVIWEARARVRGLQDKVRVLFVSIAAKGARGDIRLGVGVVPEDGVIAAVKVIENKDDKAVESKSFLEQFEGLEYSGAVSKPMAALEEARKKAKDAGDAPAKELAAFFALFEKMHAVGRDGETLDAKVEREDASGTEQARRMQAAFGDVERLVPAFGTFLQPRQVETFVAAMKASQRQAGQIADALKGGRFAEARKVLHELDNEQCRKCHAWSRRRFCERRETLGIGNGYFVVGHEIAAPPEGPPESFQAVASAVRKAVLIVTEAK